MVLLPVELAWWLVDRLMFILAVELEAAVVAVRVRKWIWCHFVILGLALCLGFHPMYSQICRKGLGWFV